MCPYETHKLAKTGGILFNPPPRTQDWWQWRHTGFGITHCNTRGSWKRCWKTRGTFDIVSPTTQKWGGCANLSTHPSTLSTCSRGDVQISQGWSIRVRSLYGVGSGPVWGAIKSLHFRCSVMQSYANFEGDTWYCVPHPPKYWGGGTHVPLFPYPWLHTCIDLV